MDCIDNQIDTIEPYVYCFSYHSVVGFNMCFYVKRNNTNSHRQPNIFNLVAVQLAALFSDVRHIVPSDVAMGLLLVRGRGD